MFNLKGLLKAMSLPLIYMIVIGFIGGFINAISIEFLLILLFFPTYIFIGIFAPMYNPKTPYFSSFIGSLTLSFLNFISGQYFFDYGVMMDPDGLNRSLILSTGTSLITTTIYFSVRRRVVNNA